MTRREVLRALGAKAAALAAVRERASQENIGDLIPVSGQKSFKEDALSNYTWSLSAVARPQERKFLGFSFSAGPEVKRVIAPKALDRFKRRIRESGLRGLDDAESVYTRRGVTCAVS